MNLEVRPLAPLEVASGIVAGSVEAESLPRAARRLPPRQALESAMLPALARPPCLVSFSGGRDSSAVLAVATLLARRQGLPAPVPITWRFADAPATEEAHWQESVIRALAVQDWVRLPVLDELELLGPVAAPALVRHGVLWPSNIHLHGPLFAHAVGGSLMTGVDGDSLFGSWRWTRLSELARRQVRPTAKDVLRLGLACSPRRVQVSVLLRRRSRELFWLRPAARAEALRAWARDEASEPLRWHQRLAWLASRRYLHLAFQSFQLLAADTATVVHHPLAHPVFLSSLAAAGGARGYGNRSAAMRALFADVLPMATIQRQTKATFNEGFWRQRTLSFARGWNGEGVDGEMVDVEALWRHWSSGFPHSGTAMLLQQAWLSQRGHGGLG